MILANINKLERYIGINENLDKAIHFIKNNDLNLLPLGKREVDDSMFINTFEYVADNQINDFYEAHKQYIDIHIVLRGKEKMAGLDIQNGILRDKFDEVNDFGLYDGKAEYETILENDICLIVFPEDLHEPKIYVNDEKIRKVVVKVKL